MYERMLEKQHMPTLEEWMQHCGERKTMFTEVDDYLTGELGAERLLRFPYGNRYGWSMKYFNKNKHICDVFAEKDAFTVMLRLTNIQFEKVYDSVTKDTKEYIDKKYPCGQGGWIHYRVLTEQHLSDVKKLLRLKV